MRKKKILLVEDDADLRALLALLLKGLGYDVFQAGDGVDGLRIATDEYPDLVLLDALMPVMDGYEVLSKLKERKVPTRVVMLTSLDSAGHIVRFTRAGACDYIVKPVKAEDLVNVVRRVLEVENTINLNINETPPIVEQLIATTEKLEHEKEKLIIENERLLKQALSRSHSQQLTIIAIRLLCLVIAVAITILLNALDVVTKQQSLFLPLIIFLLLLLPIERIRKVSLKAPKVETGVEINNQEKSE